MWNEYDNDGDEMGIFRFNDMKHEWNEYDDNGDEISTFGFNLHDWNGHNNDNIETEIIGAFFGIKQIVKSLRLGEGLS